MFTSSEKNYPYQILLNRDLFDCLKRTYAYLNEGDKVCQCYSCLKMVIQAYLNVGFLQYFSLNMHHLNDSVDILNC